MLREGESTRVQRGRGMSTNASRRWGWNCVSSCVLGRMCLCVCVRAYFACLCAGLLVGPWDSSDVWGIVCLCSPERSVALAFILDFVTRRRKRLWRDSRKQTTRVQSQRPTGWRVGQQPHLSGSDRLRALDGRIGTHTHSTNTATGCVRSTRSQRARLSRDSHAAETKCGGTSIEHRVPMRF